ncbi:LOW QUALITY PROTEIN: hypothetical protein HZS_4723 [Henneguya salminicola]|nr:LOW QUALITY PROTEIN: hypothetical protein HZS_4723 [Henneguya salminicola]
MLVQTEYVNFYSCYFMHQLVQRRRLDLRNLVVRVAILYSLAFSGETRFRKAFYLSDHQPKMDLI